MQASVITRKYIQDFFRLGGSKKDEELLDAIMGQMEFREYAHKSYICRAGDDSDGMYFIESGLVRVIGKNGESIDELQPGRYFGEYASLTGEKRMADIQAYGTAQVLRLDTKTLLAISREHPGIYSLFLKNAYDQASEKYRRLVRLLNVKRGIGSGASRKKLTFRSLLLNYALVALVFIAVLLLAPRPQAGTMHPLWLCSPIVFMVAYLVITKRALEALVLSVMYLMILLERFHFAGAFYRSMIGAITATPDLILMVLLMGSLTRLFSASGSVNALKFIAGRKIKSAPGTLFAAFLSMALIAIDEYLSIMINGACFLPLADGKRLPREKSAMVKGMSPGALCILSPISLTGIYLSGLITMTSGQKGLFIQTIHCNFAALFTIAAMLLLAAGKLPLFGGLKKAHERLRTGGPLWPEGTEDAGIEDDSANRGRVLNLLLPVLALIVSSIAAGTIEAGSFQVNVLYGMIITLIFTFFLYCFQQYMTPEQFFRNVIYGMESMLAPVVMFLVGKCFANGMEAIGFSAWLDELVRRLVQGQVWLLPVIIFSVCTLVAALFDNPWAMYAIGIPIALGFAATLNGSPALYVGAVCAAGLLGNEIAMGDIFFIGPMLGVNPMSYYRAKLPYVIAIAVLSFFAFIAAGIIGA
jgi:CRP-like cAMP-binding protein/Na+/H+ antiporter NhaC